MSNYDWINLIPEGWENIAKNMIKRCENIDPSYKIIDMKEKYGTLRIYSICDSEHYSEIEEIEEQTEQISKNYCIICGRPATRIFSYCPFCDIHDNNI